MGRHSGQGHKIQGSHDQKSDQGWSGMGGVGEGWVVVGLGVVGGIVWYVYLSAKWIDIVVYAMKLKAFPIRQVTKDGMRVVGWLV